MIRVSKNIGGTDEICNGIELFTQQNLREPNVLLIPVYTIFSEP